MCTAIGTGTHWVLHFSCFVCCEGNVTECNFVSTATSTGTVGSVAFLVCFVSCEGNVRECNSVSTAVSPGAPGSHPSTAGPGEGTLRPCQSPPSLDPQLLPFRPSSTQLTPASLLWELGPAAGTCSQDPLTCLSSAVPWRGWNEGRWQWWHTSRLVCLLPWFDWHHYCSGSVLLPVMPKWDSRRTATWTHSEQAVPVPGQSLLTQQTSETNSAWSEVEPWRCKKTRVLRGDPDRENWGMVGLTLQG